ncbi:FAD-dependent oxidoreductase [Zunongwangia sp.]|uniref:FAD-dependent oxidoreductase n=1 Tax=Zunongwangia sp. TaxID=1965325 RepID=UPI003AA8C352
MEYDLLIVGGGAAGMSCALVVGSGLSKKFGENKKVGIFMHQRSSDLQNALFNNVLGIPSGTAAKDILQNGPQHLQALYPGVRQIDKEKVVAIEKLEDGKYLITTNKENEYKTQKVVVAIGYSDTFKIRGLEKYIIPHKKAKTDKNRVQLINQDHLVLPDLYVAGTLAGWRSQYAIACGSGAAVATDILTDWNDGVQTKVHDKLA